MEQIEANEPYATVTYNDRPPPLLPMLADEAEQLIGRVLEGWLRSLT